MLNRTLRFCYNNGNLWMRNYRGLPLQTTKPQWKQSLQAGDSPQWAYSAKLVFPQEYKPFHGHAYPGAIASISIITLYFYYAYEKTRIDRGITYVNEYPSA